jgi:hypothetical protein
MKLPESMLTYIMLCEMGLDLNAGKSKAEMDEMMLEALELIQAAEASAEQP